jgi:hypothetical protein
MFEGIKVEKLIFDHIFVHSVEYNNHDNNKPIT